MKYNKYKYQESDLVRLIEKAIKSEQSCAIVFREGNWPFSEHILNGFIVGRRVAQTPKLASVIEKYRKSGLKNKNVRADAPDAEKMKEILELRQNGASLSEIEERTGIKKGRVQYFLSGNSKHPLAPKKSIRGTAKKGRKPQKKTKPKSQKVIIRRLTITRRTPIRIEIVNPTQYAAALAGYWAERDTFGAGEQGFLEHLALMGESAFIPDSVARFGVIVRAETADLRVK